MECKNVTSTDRILASIYKMTGAINLHPEAFNRAYIVVPDEASKVAGVSIPARVGIISYTVDAQVRFHVLKDSEDFPRNFSVPLQESEFAPTPRLTQVDVTAPRSFRIVRSLLEHPKMTQTSLADEADVSLGLVNKVVSYLSSKGIVEVSKKGVALNQPWKLLSEIALARPMESLKLVTIPTAIPRMELVEERIRKVMQGINQRYVLGIFSAARRYSSYFALDDAEQVYLDSLKATSFLQDAFKLPMGPKRSRSGVRIEVYRADIPEIFSEAETFEGVSVTSRAQTIIDLVSSGPKGYELATILLEKMRK